MREVFALAAGFTGASASGVTDGDELLFLVRAAGADVALSFAAGAGAASAVMKTFALAKNTNYWLAVGCGASEAGFLCISSPAPRLWSVTAKTNVVGENATVRVLIANK